MRNRIVKNLLVISIVLLMAVLVTGMGCQIGRKLPAQPSTPPPGELSSTLVPNVPLDAYVYARQHNPTRIPADMVNLPREVEAESISFWGVPAGDDFAFGMAFTLTDSEDASQLYNEIRIKGDSWKMLSGNTIYLVYGSGAAAGSLKTAISNQDFKYFDDGELLEAAAALSVNGLSRPAAVGVGRPSKALINFAAKDAGSETLGQIDLIMNIAKLNVIAVGLYSPSQIDVAEITKIVMNGGDISSLNLGLLVYVQSGLPGFLAEPAIGQFLRENHFDEVTLGELTVYKGAWDIVGGEGIPVMIAIVGNRIFVAVAAQESYVKTLITGVNK